MIDDVGLLAIPDEGPVVEEGAPIRLSAEADKALNAFGMQLYTTASGLWRVVQAVPGLRERICDKAV